MGRAQTPPGAAVGAVPARVPSPVMREPRPLKSRSPSVDGDDGFQARRQGSSRQLEPLQRPEQAASRLAPLGLDQPSATSDADAAEAGAVTPIPLGSALASAAGVSGSVAWPGGRSVAGAAPGGLAPLNSTVNQAGFVGSATSSADLLRSTGPAPYSSTMRRGREVAWGTPVGELPPDGAARWGAEAGLAEEGAAGQAGTGAGAGAEDSDSSGGAAPDETAEQVRLFLPDGSRKRTLRAVVSRALQASQFDSVSALLATQTGDAALSDAGKPAGRIALESLGVRLPRATSAATAENAGIERLQPEREGEAPAVRAVAETGVRDELIEAAKGAAAIAAAERRDTGGQALAGAGAGRDSDANDADADDDDVGNGDGGASFLPPRGPPVQLPPKRRQEACFACWSMGRGAHCNLHRPAGEKARTLPGLEADKSVMACANWSVEALARQFRDEAIHEVFSRTSASLRFDSQRQAYHTVSESRHPVYRALADGVAFFNERGRRLRRRHRWFQSLLEQVKAGAIAEGYEATSTQSRILRLRSTLRNRRWASKLRFLAQHRFPLAPVTGVVPVAPENRVTDAVIGFREAEERRRRKAERLRDEAEMTPRSRRRHEAEGKGDEEKDEGDDDPAGGQYMPIVLARARGRTAGGRGAKPRGSGKGLYAAVPTVRWRPGGEDEEGNTLVAEDDEAVAALAAQGKGSTARVRGDIADAASPTLDDPLLARAEARRRAGRFARFLTDSEHALRIVTDRKLVEASTTAMRALKQEGVVYAAPPPPPPPHRAAPAAETSPPEAPPLGLRLRLPPNLPATAPKPAAAATGGGSGGGEFEALAPESHEALGGPSHVSLGHRDHPGMAWRYIVALPVPDARALRRPLVYYPFEPRHVPVPTPEGTALKAAADEMRRYETEAPDRLARAKAEAASVRERVLAREAPLSEPIPASGAAPAGRPESAGAAAWSRAASVIQGDTAAALARRLPAHTASGSEAAQGLPPPPPELLRPGAAPGIGQLALDTTPVPSFTFFRRPPPAHDLRCTFYRHTSGREFVFGGLPSQVNLVAWVTTAVPPAFGGMVALRPSSVAPARVPDVVRMDLPGGAVDVRDLVPLGTLSGAAAGPGKAPTSEADARVAAWRAALGDEMASADAGVTAAQMEPVSEARARAALGQVRFGGAAEAAVWATDARRRAALAVQAVELRDAGEAKRDEADEADEALARAQAGGFGNAAAALLSKTEAAAAGADTLRRRAGEASEAAPGPEAALRAAAEQAQEASSALPALRGFVVFDTVDVPASSPSYSLSQLVSPLNERVPPTVTLSTMAAYHAGLAEHRRGERARRRAEKGGGGGGAAAAEDAGSGHGASAEDTPGEGAGGDDEAEGSVLLRGMPRPNAAGGRSRGADAFEGRVGPKGHGIRVLVVDGDAPLYYGENRPDQTGEAFYAGFRTAEAVAGRRADPALDAAPFLAHEEIVTSNEAVPIVGTTTHADRFYPFAVPSTAPNAAADLLYILLTSKASANEPCTFAAIGHQDGGDFLWSGRGSGAMGPLSMHVYRSLAAAQTGEIEEFRTATGVPYWYNRRSGQTYWEPPLPEAPDEALQEEDEEAALRELLDRERAAVQGPGHRLVVRLPEDLYARREDGGFVHERLLAEDGALRPDAMEVLEAEAAAAAAEEHERAVAKWAVRQQPEDGGSPVEAGPPESLTHLAGQADPGEPAADGAMLPGGGFVPMGWRYAGRATPGGFAKGAAAEAASSRAAAGGRVGGPGMGGPGAGASDVIAAGPYTQHRMRQYMMAPRQTDAFVQGAASTVLPARRPDDPPAVGYVTAADPDADTRGRAAGAAVVAVGQRFAVQRREADPREAGSAAVSDPDGAAAGAGLVREGEVRRERHRVALMRQAERQADDAVRAEAARGAADAGAPVIGALGVSGGSAVRSATRPRIGRGFIAKSLTPVTASQHAEYMPHASNNNKARVLGVVAPRQIIEDWAAVGFDPWSAGKRLRTTLLVRDIGSLEEPDSGTHAGTGADDADPTMRGLPPGVTGPPKPSLTQKLVMSADLRSKAATDARAKQQALLEQMFSYTRNGRFDALEALLAAKHTGASAVDIDTRDEVGNTLLHVACQNGNKRIVKLALRRGADINARNTGGNTPLHYAFAYGFDDLGAYLTTKGADDTLQNLDGLTPYEGLSKEDIAAL
ncbi:hypothetical protein FNF29_05052 [Cafeteria roenbergensis]|uniref:Uncharacterized protein n=1 Tax=Cafeteria roenbergensis TaxID=33653 RepID=A0A5A8CCP7_CAFRO|nr:hypothetical protein FNF29_05052 [Cafeteria roenbergensis]|eukprot:KAA0150715.1 hypothetical protein FNF29_05052 [Cafeteria roenbergensis]